MRVKNYGTNEEVMKAFINREKYPHTNNNRTLRFEDNILYSKGNGWNTEENPLVIYFENKYLLNGDMPHRTHSMQMWEFRHYLIDNIRDQLNITKNKWDISEKEKGKITSKLKLKNFQKVFFSHIDYASTVKSSINSLELNGLPKFTLVTGIANAKPLVEFLSNKGLKFDHLEYSDHYNFRASDIENLATKSLIVTTEKDYVRLSVNERLKDQLYYLPIEIKIDKSEVFNTMIKAFVN